MNFPALLPWLGFAVSAAALGASWLRFLRVERPTVRLAATTADAEQRNKLLDQVLESARFLGGRVPELEKENSACREQVLIMQERITGLTDRLSAMETHAMEATRALTARHAEEVAALNAAVARLTLRLAAYEAMPAGGTP